MVPEFVMVPAAVALPRFRVFPPPGEIASVPVLLTTSEPVIVPADQAPEPASVNVLGAASVPPLIVRLPPLATVAAAFRVNVPAVKFSVPGIVRALLTATVPPLTLVVPVML